MKRCERLVVRTAGLFPQPVLEQPERMLLAVACLIIGITGFVPPEGGLLDLWPQWAQLAWCTVMTAGGALSMFGTVTNDIPASRAGALAICGTAAIYGTALFVVYETTRVGSAVIFCCLAFAQFVRLLRTSAAAVTVLSRLRELDETQRSPDGGAP